MVRNQKMTGRAVSMPAGVFNGAVISLVITILGSAITAKLLDTGKMREEMIGYVIMVILMAASFVGALVSKTRIKRQKLLACGLAGAVYFLELMGITALFFGGQYEAVGVTGSLVIGGSLLASLCGSHTDRVGKRRKAVRANR